VVRESMALIVEINWFEDQKPLQVVKERIAGIVVIK
jgi:hypothetical protein